ncbi:hypothetical protein ACFLX2_01445 [Candidatus Dependentiae bacterium]
MIDNKKKQRKTSLDGKSIFVLGAGQVGEASAVRALRENPKKIVLHTLTEQEALLAIQNVKNVVGDVDSEIIPSWGNALVPSDLMFLSRNEILGDKQKRETFLSYLYSFMTDDILSNSSFYQLLKKHQPDIVVDAINTATVVGYLDDPYSLPRRVINDAKGSQKDINWEDSCLNVLSAAVIPSLIRFTQVLEKGIADFGIESYVKVSTTGLGGMGVNLCYTHGDLNEPGMSSGILGKVAAAGVMHQLFWSLAHTPEINIRVVVPAALIGWQPVGFGKFRSHGKNLPLVDSQKTIQLKAGDILQSFLIAQIYWGLVWKERWWFLH